MADDPILPHLTFTPQEEKGIYDVFLVSIILKGIGAVVETALGLVLLITPGVIDVVNTLLNYAIIQDPSDFFATHVRAITNLSPHAIYLGGLYLASHGIVKVLVVGGLLTRRLWAYPAAIIVLSLFAIYQVVLWFEKHSIFVLAILLFDIFIIVLTVHEYRVVREKIKP